MPTPPALPPPPTPAVPSPAPGRSAWAWARRAVALAALAGGAFGAVQTVRGYRETAARADRAVGHAETALRAVPLLTDAEVGLLRRSLNARHVALGESLGVAPPDLLGGAPPGLVRVDTLSSVLVLDGEFSDPLLTPDAAAALDLISDRFRDGLAGARLPPYRPVATSLLRSAESQAALRRVNANAAAGRSSHEFGTTFDLAYRRFEPVARVVAVAPRVPRPFRASVRRAVAARVAAEYARLAREYPSRLDAVLGRALIALEDGGVLVALRERNQAVYHVTGARRFPPP